MSIFTEYSGLVSLLREPVAVSNVAGFNISLEKKKLELGDSREHQECRYLGIDFCFQVKVICDGSNPEYPQQKERTSTFAYCLPQRNTVGDRECFRGVIANKASYIDPSYQRWGDFELNEIFKDPANDRAHNQTKREPHAYHQVWLDTPYTSVKTNECYNKEGKLIDVFGAHEYRDSTSIDEWVRQSDRKTPEWQAWATRNDRL